MPLILPANTPAVWTSFSASVSSLGTKTEDIAPTGNDIWLVVALTVSMESPASSTIEFRSSGILGTYQVFQTVSGANPVLVLDRSIALQQSRILRVVVTNGNADTRLITYTYLRILLSGV